MCKCSYSLNIYQFFNLLNEAHFSQRNENVFDLIEKMAGVMSS